MSETIRIPMVDHDGVEIQLEFTFSEDVVDISTAVHGMLLQRVCSCDWTANLRPAMQRMIAIWGKEAGSDD